LENGDLSFEDASQHLIEEKSRGATSNDKSPFSNLQLQSTPSSHFATISRTTVQDVDEAYRFYHVPASNTAVGNIILMNR